MDWMVWILIVLSAISACCMFYFQKEAGCAVFKEYNEITEELDVFDSILLNTRVFFNFCSLYIFYYLAVQYPYISICFSCLIFFIINLNAAYYKYFKEPLTFLIISNNFRESCVLFKNAASFINKKLLGLSLLFVLTQIVVCYFLQIISLTNFAKYFFYAMFGYWSLRYIHVILNVFRPSMVTGVKRACVIFDEIGILPFWMIEIFLSHKFRVKYDSVTNKDSYEPIVIGNLKDVNKIRNICIVQVESLDASIIDDEQVCPFLNLLKKQSFFCKAQTTPYQSGSADADFQMIFDHAPVQEKTIMYKVLGYDFVNSYTIAKKLSKKDFVCDFFHNFQATYYNRIKCLKHAGFRELMFMEKMLQANGEVNSSMSFKTINDVKMFDIMVQALQKNLDKKYFQFCITCTSHTPWEFLKPENKGLYKDGEDDSSFKKYANSINSTDRGLKSLYDKYSDNSLFIIYGDHNSGLAYNGNDCVSIPVLIAQKNVNLSNDYVIDKQLACSGDLCFINIVKWIHEILS